RTPAITPSTAVEEAVALVVVYPSQTTFFLRPQPSADSGQDADSAHYGRRAPAGAGARSRRSTGPGLGSNRRAVRCGDCRGAAKIRVGQVRLEDAVQDSTTSRIHDQWIYFKGFSLLQRCGTTRNDAKSTCRECVSAPARPSVAIGPSCSRATRSRFPR